MQEEDDDAARRRGSKINSKGNTECTILSLNGGILATRMRKLLLGCLENFKGARGTYG